MYIQNVGFYIDKQMLYVRFPEHVCEETKLEIRLSGKKITTILENVYHALKLEK